MTEVEIQTIVQEVMRRMLAENGSNARNAVGQSNSTALAAIGHDTPSPAKPAEDDTVVVSTVITRNDIADFARAGKKTLIVQHSGMVRPLAHELPTNPGIYLVWESETKGVYGQETTHDL